MYSNCLLHSIKQYILNPTNIKIIKRGSWLEIFGCKWPNFYWFDKRDNHYYHFCAKYSDEPFINQIWFEGEVKRFLWHNKSEMREYNDLQSL